MYPEHNFCSDRQYMPEQAYMMSNMSAYVRPTNMIYVNKNIVNPSKTKVLVNPNFNRHVHVNPKFTNKSTTIFVNPNVFKKSTQSSTTTQLSNQVAPFTNNILPERQTQGSSSTYNSAKPIIISKYSKINNTASFNQKTITNETVIKTKTKFLRVQATPSTKMSHTNGIHILPSSKSPLISKTKRIVSRHKLIKINNNSPKAIVKSKYKIIRTLTSVPRSTKQHLPVNKNRFKIDNRSVKRRQSFTIIKSPYKLTKKAYMMRLDPQNTIIKNTKFKLIRSKKIVSIDRARKINEKSLKSKNFKKNLVKINNKKLKKNNIPCEIYNKKGKCKGLTNGKCSKKHDPNQIQICIWFLQGICRDDKCSLSHKVSSEKMPTCKFFLEGMCHKDDCPYLHVKLSKDAPVCIDFLNGYCAKGLECDKRHQFLCPDYEKEGKCNKKLCRYPHGKAVRQYKDNLLKLIARNRKSKASLGIQEVKRAKMQKKQQPQETNCEDNGQHVGEVDNKRYYECSGDSVKSKSEQTENAAHYEQGVNVFDRPKLGALPSFISF